MGFESQKLLIGMIMTLILGQVTTQSTGKNIILFSVFVELALPFLVSV